MSQSELILSYTHYSCTSTWLESRWRVETTWRLPRCLGNTISRYSPRTVARWPKILQNNSKGAAKISLGWATLVAVYGPQFCQKMAERAWKICFYYSLCFQGQFRHKFNFLCCEHGFIIKYFLPKPLKNTCMTMHNFVFIFQKLFLKLAGKPRWDLATVLMRPAAGGTLKKEYWHYGSWTGVVGINLQA